MLRVRRLTGGTPFIPAVSLRRTTAYLAIPPYRNKREALKSFSLSDSKRQVYKRGEEANEEMDI